MYLFACDLKQVTEFLARAGNNSTRHSQSRLQQFNMAEHV